MDSGLKTKFLRQLAVLGHIEGASLLLLLFIAMPLKYLAGKPEAVRILGTAHGFLWIGYLAMLGIALLRNHLPFREVFFGGVASVLPFGPWWFDRRLSTQN